MVISNDAREYGRRAADKLLAGRTGHGGGPCLKRNLDRAQLEAVCAAAFQMGREYERRERLEGTGA